VGEGAKMETGWSKDLFKEIFLTKAEKYRKKKYSVWCKTKTGYRKLVALFFVLVCRMGKPQ
jgi:hypothetical protein